MKYLTATVIVAAIALTGCRDEGQDATDKALANEQQKQYGVAQPIPRFDWSLERDLVRQLYQIRNRSVGTYSVWTDFGKVVGHCPSIGYGVPYDTSLTNPLKAVSGHSSLVAIEQAEPNGIFASKNTSATWVFCAIDTGEGPKIAPVYVEQKVAVYPFPVKVEDDRIVVPANVKPTATIETKQ